MVSRAIERINLRPGSGYQYATRTTLDQSSKMEEASPPSEHRLPRLPLGNAAASLPQLIT